MSDVHIIGEIEGARSFGKSNIFLTFEFVTGSQWLRVAGDDAGQTHTIDNEETTPFSHPIDVHYRANAMDGWPRILINVWSLDNYGRREFQGYGSAYIAMPQAMVTAASAADDSFASMTVTDCFLEIPTWQPKAPTIMGNIRAMLLGGGPFVKEPSIITDPDERYKLHAISRGVITARLSVAVRGRLVGDASGGHA